MWWRLTMACPPELEESLVWKLTDLGLHRHAVQHAPETPDQKQLLLWLPQPEWPEAERQQLLASLEPLAEPFGLPLPQGHWDDVADEDWSLSWKQHWQPDPVGDGLLILPAWLEVPPEHGERLVIRMDPGSAFGTGSHPTTRLCLEALEKAPPVGALVEDLGCGSGVLGLAALGLGATAVVVADLRPTGTILIDGMRKDAISVSGLIEKGTEVRILKEGMRYQVERLETES